MGDSIFTFYEAKTHKLIFIIFYFHRDFISYLDYTATDNNFYLFFDGIFIVLFDIMHGVWYMVYGVWMIIKALHHAI